MRRLIWRSGVLAVSVLALSACYERELPVEGDIPAGTGGFQDDLVIRLDADGRKAVLIEDFTYIDSDNVAWTAPSGWVVDGASIPQALWGFIGGPFSGKYRNASVIHDYYCDERIRPWEEVHRVFYDAMLTSGVEPRKAATMFSAVYRFGPRWDMAMDFTDGDVFVPVSVGSYIPDFSQDAYDALEAEINAQFGTGPVEQTVVLSRTLQLDEAVRAEMIDKVAARIEAARAAKSAEGPPAEDNVDTASAAARSVTGPQVFVIEDLNAPL
ncbi:MAG: DUF1353 domain-containing protein [Pseudomonadota bacterium]